MNLSKHMQKRTIALVLVLFLQLSIITAFGVSSPYWGDNPLTMKKGETKIVEINVQNGQSDDDVFVLVKILRGEEIVSLNKERYRVPKRTTDTMVPVTIKIPKDTTQKVYDVAFDFKTTSEEEGTGPVTLGLGATIGFEVLVSDEPYIPEETPLTKNSYLIVGIIGAVIIIAGIIFFILRSRSNSKKK